MREPADGAAILMTMSTQPTEPVDPAPGAQERQSPTVESPEVARVTGVRSSCGKPSAYATT